MGEVFVGGDNGSLYGFMVGGNSLTGFPFSAGDKIRSSPAVGDVDNDGNNEVVFGSHDGKLYIVNIVGNQEMVYLQNGYIVESGPAKQVFSNPEEVYTDKLLNAALRYSTV